MNAHTVRAFEEELRSLSDKILHMGGLTEHMLADAVRALDTQDIELAARVIAEDARVDALEAEVEEMAVLVIARRQPVAVDLRAIVAAMRISHDLERVGDLAKNISKRVSAIGDDKTPHRLSSGLKHMVELTLAQIKDALDAYVEQDAEKAVRVRDSDEAIDALYTALFRELLTYMMEDPRNISPCAHMLFCAKNIERVGDHATNVAETVYYLVKGDSLRDGRPMDDRTTSREEASRVPLPAPAAAS